VYSLATFDGKKKLRVTRHVTSSMSTTSKAPPLLPMTEAAPLTTVALLPASPSPSPAQSPSSTQSATPSDNRSSTQIQSNSHLAHHSTSNANTPAQDSHIVASQQQTDPTTLPPSAVDSILGARRNAQGQLELLVKWSDDSSNGFYAGRASYESAQAVNKLCPLKVIAFYERNLEFVTLPVTANLPQLQ
jgi:hypothetical protein